MNASQEAEIERRRELFSTENVEKMVHTFYGRVQDDEVLGPIFDRRIDDWPHHLGRMVRFWRSVLRAESMFAMSNRGSPPVLHRNIEELHHSHFDRWLGLFADVADEIYSAEASAEVKATSRRIARALSRHLPDGKAFVEPDTLPETS